MSALPRISIITPSYQQASYLPECLASVADQGYPDTEHIVMDGGSKDGSRAVLEAHAKQLAYWQSTPDKGQSDAINQGLARATGQVFNWVNSDDALLPGALAKVGEAFAADPALLVFGGSLLFYQDGVDTPGQRINGDDPLRLFLDPVINQPATFLRMDAVRALGGVETKLRYVMDLELWWQLLFRHGTGHLRFQAEPLARFRFHGASKTVSESRGFLDETASILHGLCTSTGNHDLAAVLAIGHQLSTGLRPIPTNTTHRELVRAMALHFLLKWHGTIHRREQFAMMRAFRKLPVQGIPTIDGMERRIPALDQQLASGSWAMFRLRRKWQHLRA